MKKLFLLMTVLFLLLVGTTFGAGQEESAAVSEEVPELFVWGVPSWAGTYTSEMLALGNEWAKEKFGATFRVQSVSEGSSHIQALNLLMAKGDFPDVMSLGWSMDTPTKNMIAKLYDDGRIAVLDKYFNMPEELPNLAKTNMDYLSAYKYKGNIVAFPAYGATLQEDAPPWVSPVWISRFDIAKDNRNNLPTSTDELYDLLKSIKGNYVDTNGDPIIPLGINQSKNLSSLTDALKQFKGAGWQSTDNGKYVPMWATMEMYESLKFVNRLWSEGLMDPGLWTMDMDKYQEILKNSGYGVNVGNTWNVSISATKMMNIVKESDLDSKAAQEYRDKMYVMLVHPIIEANGTMSPLHNIIAGPTLISSAIDPMPMMRFFDYMHSMEGLIAYQADAGEKDVDWEFMDAPLYWQVKGTDGSQTIPPENKRGAWTAASAIDMDNPPKVVPTLMYFASPSYSSYYDQLYANNINEVFPSYGWPMGTEEDFGFTNYNVMADWCNNYKDYVTPTPSYQLFIPELEPLEDAMLSTAEERWIEGLPKVITSSNFDADYKDFIAALIKVGNQKPIYEKLQNAWENWMKENGDDRDTYAGTATAIPQWKAVMGW